MLTLAHHFLIALYLALPSAAVVIDILRARRRKRTSPSGSLVLSIFAAIPIGIVAPLVYAKVMHGTVRLPQVLLAVYAAAALLLLLRALDALLRLPSVALARRAAKHPEQLKVLATFDLLAGVGRIVLLLALGLPFVMATTLTYRPKVAQTDDPAKHFGYRYDNVSFLTDDHERLAGWFIPASPRTGRVAASGRTVVICHGMTGDKARQLSLARYFVPRGYNVLIFDFRAFGDSSGQIFSYGDVERRDVLAAVHWLRSQHPRESRHVYGVGVDTGGAALIAAAADASPDGQAIQAVAVYGTFDSLSNWSRSAMHDRFIQPMRWLIEHLSLPMASLQTGADLSHFSPAQLIQRLWPRPVMIVHGVRDSVVDFDRGAALYDAASQPKQRTWISDEGHEQSLRDPGVGQQVKEFFDDAAPVPVI